MAVAKKKAGKKAPARKPRRGAPKMEIASLWTRFVAGLADGMLLQVVLLPIYMTSGVRGGFLLDFWVPQHPGGPLLSLLVHSFSLFILMGYPIIMLAQYQATLGRMAVGIKVVRGDGRVLDWGHSIGRECASLLSGCLCLIGYLIAFGDEKNRTMHDRIADTLVVKA